MPSGQGPARRGWERGDVPLVRKERSIGMLYAITLILSACSLLYELLIAQTLSLLAANMVVWYSLTVGTFLGAMGLGAFLLGARYRRTTAWVALFQIEILLSILGALAVILVHAAHVLHAYLKVHNMAGAAILVFFGTAFVVIFLVVVLLVGLIGRIISRALRHVSLGWLDRLAGAILGLVVASVILSVILLLAAMAGLEDQKLLAESRMAPKVIGVTVSTSSAPMVSSMPEPGMDWHFAEAVSMPSLWQTYSGHCLLLRVW